MKTGAELIAEERARLIQTWGWDAEHDDQFISAQLITAAEGYTNAAWNNVVCGKTQDLRQPAGWPFGSKVWSPSTDPVRNLAKAGALIAAEIDRLNREASHRAEITKLFDLPATPAA